MFLRVRLKILIIVIEYFELAIIPTIKVIDIKLII